MVVVVGEERDGLLLLLRPELLLVNRQTKPGIISGRKINGGRKRRNRRCREIVGSLFYGSHQVLLLKEERKWLLLLVV